MKIRELKKLLSHIKRVKNYIFDNIEVEKHKFDGHKNPISIYDVNINRIVVSNKVPFGKKGFISFVGYEDDSLKNMPLFIMLLKMSAYRITFFELNICLFWEKITNC